MTELDDRTVADPYNVFRNLSGSITALRKSTDDRTPSGRSRATIDVTCLDQPGNLVRFIEWIASKYAINIIESNGRRTAGCIHKSDIIVEISNEHFERLNMELINKSDHIIEIPDQAIYEDSRKFSMRMLGMDQPGIFNIAGNTFTKNGRGINIISYWISTKDFPTPTLLKNRYPDLKEVKMALIEMRIEVPIRTISSLPEIIHELGKIGPGWIVEPGDLDGSRGFDRLPIGPATKPRQST